MLTFILFCLHLYLPASLPALFIPYSLSHSFPFFISFFSGVDLSVILKEAHLVDG